MRNPDKRITFGVGEGEQPRPETAESAEPQLDLSPLDLDELPDVGGSYGDVGAITSSPEAFKKVLHGYGEKRIGEVIDRGLEQAMADDEKLVA
ncbi:MAG: hypothetical protein AAB932_05300 [Patescibacteria group bacterium]